VEGEIKERLVGVADDDSDSDDDGEEEEEGVGSGEAKAGDAGWESMDED